jgi:hypothetical protein
MAGVSPQEPSVTWLATGEDFFRMIRWPRVASATTTGVVVVALSGCMSLESIRASNPTHTTVVKGSATAITRCIQSELDLSISDSDPDGTEFALLAQCEVCMQGHF